MRDADKVARYVAVSIRVRVGLPDDPGEAVRGAQSLE